MRSTVVHYLYNIPTRLERQNDIVGTARLHNTRAVVPVLRLAPARPALT